MVLIPCSSTVARIASVGSWESLTKYLWRIEWEIDFLNLSNVPIPVSPDLFAKVNGVCFGTVITLRKDISPFFWSAIAAASFVSLVAVRLEKTTKILYSFLS